MMTKTERKFSGGSRGDLGLCLVVLLAVIGMLACFVAAFSHVAASVSPGASEPTYQRTLADLVDR